MRIINIEIENYRCFKEKIEWNPNPNLNVIVGENNSGKSSLFKFIEQIHKIHQFNSDNFGEKEWSNLETLENIEFKMDYIVDQWVLEEIYELKKRINLSDNGIITFLFNDEKMSREIKNDGSPESIVWECRIYLKDFISTLKGKNYTIEEIKFQILTIFQENSEQGFDIDEFSFNNGDSSFNILRELLVYMVFYSQTPNELKMHVESSIKYGRNTNPTIILDKISRKRHKWSYNANFEESEGLTYYKIIQNKWFENVESYLHSLLEDMLVNIKEIRIRSKVTKSNTYSCPDGSELNGVLYNLMMNADKSYQNLYNEIQNEFQSFYPNYEFRMVEDDGNLSIQVSDNIAGKEHKLEDYGTGMMDILIIITNLIASKGKIILIEEPETHIHPIFQRKLMNLIDEMKTRNQIFITTHSPIIINSNCIDSVLRVVRNNSNSKIYPFNLEYLIDRKNQRFTKTNYDSQAIKVKYSQLLTSDVKNAFFAKGVILVEGETEKLSIPVWSKYLGFNLDNHSIEVVNCHSKNNIINILELFQMYHFHVFVIFDMDNPEKDQHKKYNKLIIEAVNFTEKKINQENYNERDNSFVFSPNYEESLYGSSSSYSEVEKQVIIDNKFRSGRKQKGLKAYYTALKYQELKKEAPEIIKSLLKKVKAFFT